MKVTARIFAYSFILINLIIIALKFTIWDYTFQKILPQKKYEVSLDITAEAFDQPINISTYLPISDFRQTINNEVNNSTLLNLHIEQLADGRLANWSNANTNGSISVNYSFDFYGKSLLYSIDSTLVIDSNIPPGMEEYLAPTGNIQVNHPLIHEIYDREVGDDNHISTVLKSIHSYTNSLNPRPFKGVTDALTAAKLGEASCNGKSRLFIALSRTANIPSRLVGGVILTKGSKKTSHQWAEVYIQGEWVPFDPLNDHYGFLPDNYLSLYKGDEFLFSHTPNINFDYRYNIKSRLSPNPLLFNELKAHPLNAYKLWQVFDQIGIPLGLLKIILLLPLGVLIVAIFRNVIGIQTFGVFLPALIAVASRETGLFWGLVAFLMVIFIVSLVHFPMEKWGILYTPRLVIMLICVVILFIFTAYFSITFNLTSLAYITLFPIVVLTISAERFARTITEQGLGPALLLTLQTMIVAIAAYFAMNSNSMEAFFLGFPELFLVIIGINLLLGQWIGLRVAEFFRFRILIR